MHDASSGTYVPPSAAFSRPRVALDVDEVLCRTAEAFCTWHSGQPATDLTESFQRCYSTDSSALRDQFLCSDFSMMAEPVFGSQEALQQLKTAGFELHAVTSRPGSCKSSTERFLARCFPALISGLHFASVSGPTKGELCRQLGVVILVDDQLQNILDAVSHGVRCVVLDLQGHYVWNHSTSLPNGAVRLYSWAEIANYVMGLQGNLGNPMASAASHASQFVPRTAQSELSPSVPSSAPEGRPGHSPNGYSVPSTQVPPTAGMAGPQVPQTQLPQLPQLPNTSCAVERPPEVSQAPRAQLPQGTPPPVHSSELATQQLQMPQMPQMPEFSVPKTVPKTQLSGETREVTFKPRLPMGIFVSDVQGGRVSGVLDGQAKEQGLEPHFVMVSIDGQPYSEALLEEKKKGNVPYRVAIRQLPPPDAEVLIECIKVVGQDVTAMPPELRHLELEVYSEPCFVGRAEQANFFQKLMPDEELRNCISRRHFSLSWAGALQFTRLSVNTIFANQVFAPVNGTMFLPDGALLYLCSSGDENIKGRKQKAACMSPLEFISFLDEEIDEQVPVAVFRVTTLKVGGRAVEAQQPAPVRARMLCTSSQSVNVEMMPMSARSFPVHPHTKVGREHQQEFFEAVLGQQSCYWTAISRSHLVLTEVDPGSFLVQNLSVNHVMVAGRHLQKGQQTTVQVKTTFDFLAVPPGSPPATVPQCFLRLELVPEDPHAEAPKAQSPRKRSFWLELSGSAALEKRRVDASDGKIVVGRAWQFDLHKKALREEVQTFVSREHFRVEELASGGAATAFPQKKTLRLTALSSNPIWMSRSGQVQQLSKEDFVEVDAGDCILLYTGARDGTPNGPGSVGELIWTVQRD